MSPLARQQQALLNALWAPPELTEAAFSELSALVYAPWQRGLAAYRANARALAERALQAAFPVVAQLIGADSFALMACEFWHRHPPERGDIAWWGGALPGFLAGNPQLANVPYLADVAQVEWALHRIAGAADAQAAPASFALLGQHEPDTLTLLLPPGTLLYRSNWPVASLVAAHLHGEPAFDAVAAAVQSRQGETALVWRQGLRPRLACCAAADAAMLQALLAGQPLLAALEAALAVEPQFDFSAWLNAAVAQGQVVGAACLPDSKPPNP